MATGKAHAEWLSLIEVSGPFLTLPVLTRVFPAGLEPTDRELVEELRVAYAEVTDDPTLSPRWVHWVLERLLDLPDAVLRHGAAIPGRLTHRVSEYAVELRPDYVVVDPGGDTSEPKVRLLVAEWPWGAPLDERPSGSSWAATPLDRMEELCRATGVRLGLVTNGETWVLVDAPAGGARGTATWDAELWLEERSTLDAFTTLLGARRFFTVPDAETLDVLLAESASAEAEVTDQLGRQVRQAVELLIDAWSRVNRDRNGQLFGPLTHAEIYQGAVTVLMRLVFLLCAEERGLFLLGDPLYDSSYAVSTLRSQLEEEANTYGEDVLERHTGAWHRLLATFRMVHAGAHHENLSLPAYGGSLFDPDRFGWLEGRHPADPPGTLPAVPVPVDDRTALHILDALQVLRFRRRGDTDEARHLSFRALDVEQIGHVYEGLLDHGAVAVDDVVLGLSGKKEPELLLDDIETHACQSRLGLEAWLADQTGLSAKAVSKALDREPTPEETTRLASACDNDHALAERIAPYLGLVHRDLRGLPQVWLPGSVVMTQAGDRRSSGTYYTPRALAEEMVHHALEPLVYRPGPADGAPPDSWTLRPAADLLDLRICDMAMGSGAFLVAACRYLGARLLEAWSAEGRLPGDPVGPPGGTPVPLPGDETDREVLALRLVADRCIYGVDRNPMAVEMAKLSLWLVTLAKDRPFSFVDHALRAGDSLLGITSLAQLEYLHLDPARGAQLHGGTLFDPTTVVRPLVEDAVRKRREIESFLVLDVADAETKRNLFEQAHRELDQLAVIADVVVGASLSTATQSDNELENRLLAIAPDVRAALDPSQRPDDQATRIEDLRLRSEYWLDEGRPPMAPDRSCFHWTLEFPEVFLDRERPGFDAVVGNPPFMGAPKITEHWGDSYHSYLASLFLPFSKRVDICAYFFRRAAELVCANGIVGLLATNSIREGNTRRGGLDPLLKEGCTIIRARKDFIWPGVASVVASGIHLISGHWEGQRHLNDQSAVYIDSLLESSDSALGAPLELVSNRGSCFQGGTIWGDGFYLSARDALAMLQADPKNIEVVRPALGGQELNAGDVTGQRWIIDFGNRTENEAEAFSLPFEHLRRTVRDWRIGLDQVKYSRIVRAWWKHFHAREDLYAGIEQMGLSRVICRSRVSRRHMLAFVDTGIFFLDAVIIFLFDSDGDFAVLQSSVHEAWCHRYASRLKSDLRYGARNCFNTFPFPLDANNELGRITIDYLQARADVVSDRAVGLTGAYGLLDNKDESSDDVVAWRDIVAELDNEVMRAYGWGDIPLDHGFYPTDQGIQFTLGITARAKLLERLVQLNHIRHAEEVESGLFLKNGRTSVSRRRSSLPTTMQTLFEVEQ